jgi:hypothetical protein
MAAVVGGGTAAGGAWPLGVSSAAGLRIRESMRWILLRASDMPPRAVPDDEVAEVRLRACLQSLSLLESEGVADQEHDLKQQRSLVDVMGVHGLTTYIYENRVLSQSIARTVSSDYINVVVDGWSYVPFSICAGKRPQRLSDLFSTCSSGRAHHGYTVEKAKVNSTENLCAFFPLSLTL